MEIVGKTGESFSELNLSERKTLMDHTASLSRKQAEQIEVISRALNGMEKVVRDNEINAQEAAFVSESMNVQTIHLQNVVQELGKIIGRNGA